jgi:hypothetical protein
LNQHRRAPTTPDFFNTIAPYQTFAPLKRELALDGSLQFPISAAYVRSPPVRQSIVSLTI